MNNFQDNGLSNPLFPHYNSYSLPMPHNNVGYQWGAELECARAHTHTYALSFPSSSFTCWHWFPWTRVHKRQERSIPDRWILLVRSSVICWFRFLITRVREKHAMTNTSTSNVCCSSGFYFHLLFLFCLYIINRNAKKRRGEEILCNRSLVFSSHQSNHFR